MDTSMETERKKVEIRSEQFHEILSTPPNALLRWGSTVCAAVIGLLLAGSCLIKYPEVVNCQVVITSSNPPVWMVAKSTGKLQALNVGDHQTVKAGEIVAVLENTAKTEDVITLEKQLDGIHPETFSPIRLSVPNEEALGDVQSSYTQLLKAVADYNNFLENNVYERKIATGKAQLASYDAYVRSMSQQQRISDSRQDLTAKTLAREKALYRQGLISRQEYEEAQQALLAGNLNKEQITSTLRETDVSIAQLRHTINELETQQNQERNRMLTDVQSALHQTRTAIREWRQRYLLISPVNGRLAYNDYWKTNQNVTEGSQVFSVVNNEQGRRIAKLKVPLRGAGRIKPGQPVNIHLDAYPYLEFGFIKGEVESLSTMYADDGTYTATVSLPTGLTTTYRKTIPVEGDLSGTAEVITQNMSLAARLISPLRYLLARNL